VRGKIFLARPAKYYAAPVTAVDPLGAIDPDDPRPASHQIANHLRAAILTRRYPPGERLPSQYELADRYDVARETVKSALRILRDERLIVTRQGSGAFVRSQAERPVGLRPHIESAFERAKVSIDFAGFSGETLHGALQEPLDKIRAGRLTPDSIAIRILLPDMTEPAAVPARADGRDDPAVRERSAAIARRHIEAIDDSIRELVELGLVRESVVEVRGHSTAALVKVYIINRQEVFFGFYPVLTHSVRVGGRSVAIRDVMGKDSTLFHFTIEDDDHAIGTPFVEQAQQWFDSVWDTISREYVP
jgi:DNA-binding transcriptional regulator YhcF (GntR family)